MFALLTFNMHAALTLLARQRRTSLPRFHLGRRYSVTPPAGHTPSEDGSFRFCGAPGQPSLILTFDPGGALRHHIDVVDNPCTHTSDPATYRPSTTKKRLASVLDSSGRGGAADAPHFAPAEVS
jgi:hypothetical protein